MDAYPVCGISLRDYDDNGYQLAEAILRNLRMRITNGMRIKTMKPAISA